MKKSKIQTILATLSLRGYGDFEIHKRTGISTKFLQWIRGGHLPSPPYSTVRRYGELEIQSNCEALLRYAARRGVA